MRSATYIILSTVLVFLLAAGGAAAFPPPPTGAVQLARTMSEVEGSIWQALAAANLTERLMWIAADTNGHLTIAWLVFTYPPDLADPVPMLQARAWELVRTTFSAVPSLDEIQLSGLPGGSNPFGPNRHLVTFSAAVSRAEFLGADQSANPAQVFRRFLRIWFHPTLAQLDRGPPMEDRSIPPARRLAPDQSIRFSGDPAAQAAEMRHHIAGLIYGDIVEGKLYHGDPSGGAVALTFDDGPFPIYTTLLLDTLDRLHIKATFFLVGEQVEQYPYFAQAIARAGHEIANHSFHHPNLAQLAPPAVEDELRSAQEAIATVTGVTPKYFRPPGGDYNDTVLRIARALGLVTVFWTDNPGDYLNRGPHLLEARTLANITNGGIILFHQGVGDTIRILPRAAEALQRRGLTLTTVSGLLATSGRTRRRLR